MSKEAFNIEAVNETFTTHPKIEVVYQTSDEQCFTTEQAAVSHAGYLKNKKIATIARDAKQAEGLENSKAVKAAEAIEAIKLIKTVAEVDAYVDGDSRSTVIEAANEQKAIIEANS